MANKGNDIYRIPDNIWKQIKPLLPPGSIELKQESREAMEGILYMIRTEGRLGDMKAENLIYEYFREWRRTGVFDRLWQAGILTYDEMRTLVSQDD